MSDHPTRPERRDFLTTASGLGGALAVGGAGLAGLSFGPIAGAASMLSSIVLDSCGIESMLLLALAAVSRGLMILS